MGKSSGPKPPDPKDLASASTGTNLATAIANTQLGNVNVQGPGGNLSYSQSGSTQYTDPYTGQTYDIPQFTATQELSPQQQALLDNMPGFDTQAVEDRISELGRQRLDPRFEQQRAALEQRLANQGLTPGSAAWNAEMQNFSQGQNDAYNQLALQGRGQAFNELLQQRQAPINEFNAVVSGTQANPVNSPARAATTDVAGLIDNNYRQRLQAWQQQQAQQQQILGGLFGLGSAAIMASDRRLKKDVRLVGNNGLNIYEYRYIWESDRAPVRRGYMAQEVLRKVPGAVVSFGRWLALDYGKLRAL